MNLQADYRPTTFHKQHPKCLGPHSQPTKMAEWLLPAPVITMNLCPSWAQCCFHSMGCFVNGWSRAIRGQQRRSVITQLSRLEKMCHSASAPDWFRGVLTWTKDRKYHRGGLKGSVMPVITANLQILLLFMTSASSPCWRSSVWYLALFICKFEYAAN